MLICSIVLRSNVYVEIYEFEDWASLLKHMLIYSIVLRLNIK